MEKKVIILDLTDCKYFMELHQRIIDAFDFPEWFGTGVDAFWDLLWSDCDADEVVIKGMNTMSEPLIDYMKRLCWALDKKVEEREQDSKIYSYINPFSYRIED